MKDDDPPDLFGWEPPEPPKRKPYNGEPPFQRHSPTSRAAAESIPRKRISRLHRELTDFLDRRARGATDEQMQDDLMMGANTQRPRRCELVEAGYLLDSGKTDLTRSGREAVLWVRSSKPVPAQGDFL